MEEQKSVIQQAVKQGSIEIFRNGEPNRNLIFV